MGEKKQLWPVGWSQLSFEEHKIENLNLGLGHRTEWQAAHSGCDGQCGIAWIWSTVLIWFSMSASTIHCNPSIRLWAELQLIRGIVMTGTPLHCSCNNHKHLFGAIKWPQGCYVIRYAFTSLSYTYRTKNYNQINFIENYKNKPILD